MEHTAEEVRKHVRSYFIIGGILYILTIITVAISYLHLPVVPSIVLAMIVATIKGSLVALFFMHLISEKQLIYWALILTAIFFVVLMGLPVGQYLDIFDGVIP